LASDAQFSKKAWLPMHISRFTVVRYLASDAHFKTYNSRHLASDAQKAWLPMHKLQDFRKFTPLLSFSIFSLIFLLISGKKRKKIPKKRNLSLV
jgi:hypothetical protein